MIMNIIRQSHYELICIVMIKLDFKIILDVRRRMEKEKKNDVINIIFMYPSKS